MRKPTSPLASPSPAAGACTSPDSTGAGVHALIPTKASAAKREALASRTDREHVRREITRLRLAIAVQLEKAEEQLAGVLLRDCPSSGHFEGGELPIATWRTPNLLWESHKVGLLFDFLIEAATVPGGNP